MTQAHGWTDPFALDAFGAPDAAPLSARLPERRAPWAAPDDQKPSTPRCVRLRTAPSVRSTATPSSANGSVPSPSAFLKEVRSAQFQRRESGDQQRRAASSGSRARNSIKAFRAWSRGGPSANENYACDRGESAAMRAEVSQETPRQGGDGTSFTGLCVSDRVPTPAASSSRRSSRRAVPMNPQTQLNRGATPTLDAYAGAQVAGLNNGAGQIQAASPMPPCRTPSPFPGAGTPRQCASPAPPLRSGTPQPLRSGTPTPRPPSRGSGRASPSELPLGAAPSKLDRQEMGVRSATPSPPAVEGRASALVEEVAGAPQEDSAKPAALQLSVQDKGPSTEWACVMNTLIKVRNRDKVAPLLQCANRSARPTPEMSELEARMPVGAFDKVSHTRGVHGDAVFEGLEEASRQHFRKKDRMTEFVEILRHQTYVLRR